MKKTASSFTVENLAKIGELEDTYALYEHVLALYDDTLQKYLAAYPGGFPDLNRLCRKNLKELTSKYYNSHLYLFTDEYRKMFCTAKMVDILQPIYLTPSKRTPCMFNVHRETFAHYLENLITAAAINIHIKKAYAGIVYTVDEAVTYINERIRKQVKDTESAVDNVHAPKQMPPSVPDLIIYHSLNTISCRLKSHEIATGKRLVYPMNNPEKPICLPVHICQTCYKEFVGEQTYYVFTKEYGPLLIRSKQDSDIDDPNYYAYRSESKLHRLGYNVRDGEMSDSERREKLRNLIETRSISYLEVVTAIEQSIRQFSGRQRYELAVKKWKDDLLFLGNYINQHMP